MDFLSDILSRSAMRGTLYFRSSFADPWLIALPQYKNVARFHYAHRGTCHLTIKGTETPITIEEGDVIIVPHGASHALHSGEVPQKKHAPLEETVCDGVRVSVYGHTDRQAAINTKLISGHLSFGVNIQHILFERLPAFIHIKNNGEEIGSWIETTLVMMKNEVSDRRKGSDVVSRKLLEIFLVQAIRSAIEDGSAARWGLGGFSDKQLSLALDAFHKAPHENWTTSKLAKAAGMPPSSFADTFQKKMDLTPVRYRADWKQELAKQTLTDPTKQANYSGVMLDTALTYDVNRTLDSSSSTPGANNRRDRRLN